MANPNPPAFPQHLIETRDGAIQASYDAADGAGMELRDYFAAAALPAVMAARFELQRQDLLHSDPRDVSPDLNQESIAEECYELADAMLAERERVR